MPAATRTKRMPAGPFRSKRLLALAGDERLVEQIRRGNELAFEVAFERHGGPILGFCRHMLGSREEAEDAVQQTFAAAFRDLQRGGERQIALKAWLYTIARNRCLSMLRARREQTAELHEIPTAGLDEQVESRAELRELLADLRELPDEQRAALLLAEAADLSHAEVAGVLGCEVARVKALVFRARSGLIERREARETPCGEIREQLANLRGGSLRRSELRHHLRHCTGCSDFREQVRTQRKMLGAALPVVPTVGLKSSVLAAAGLGGGSAGIAGGGVVLGGSFGSAAIAKLALVGVLAGGGVVASEAVVQRALEPEAAGVTPAAEQRGSDAGSVPNGPGSERSIAGPGHGARISAERSHGRRGAERRAARSRGRGTPGFKAKAKAPPGQSRANRGRAVGQEKRALKPTPATPKKAQATVPATQKNAQATMPAGGPKSAPAAPEAAPAPLPKPLPPGKNNLPK